MTANLALLGYFKYANFFVDNLDSYFGLDGGEFQLAKILLPISISFFTFQQIAYLVDCHRFGQYERNLLRYSLFVSCFPQLIAGPIVHHSEVLTQYASKRLGQWRPSNLAVGTAIFSMGLFKS